MTIYDLKLSQWLNAVKSSQVISQVSMKLQFQHFGDYRCLYHEGRCDELHGWLSKSYVLLVHDQASRAVGESYGQVSQLSQSMLLNLDIPGYQLLLTLPSIVASWPYFVRVCWWQGSRIDSKVNLSLCMMTGMTDPHPLPLMAHPWTRIQGCESQLWVWIQWAIVPLITSTLMMETEMLDCNSILTWLITQQDFTADDNMLCWSIVKKKIF
jgi:hypothetical protein